MNYGIKDKDSLVKYVFNNIGINEPVDLHKDNKIYEDIKG